MNHALSRPLRRALALAILFGLIWMAWTAVISPAIDLPFAREATIDALADRLNNLREIVSRRAMLEHKLAALETQLSAADGFWALPSDEAMSAAVTTSPLPTRPPPRLARRRRSAPN